MMSLLLRLVILISATHGSFSPDTKDYDAYGIKVAANEIMLVEAQGSSATFLIKFNPYNYGFGSLQCYFSYDDSTHYVYSVGIGTKQNSSQAYFFFAGEVATSGPVSTDGSGRNGTFIGIWANQDPESAQTYANNHQSLNCSQFELLQLKFVSSYSHQEFFVLAIDPYGQYAFGFAKDFVIVYKPFSSNVITTSSSSLVWPNNATFMPRAAHSDISYTIVAGYVENSATNFVLATPTVYLLLNNNLTVLSTWSYTATNQSWQSRLTYLGIDSWANKYSMSVNINVADPTHVLVGIPFLNTVFLFVVSNNGTNLTLVSSFDNGQSIGFGKSVTWLTATQAAVLVSTYSFDYTTWYSSRIYLYTLLNSTSLQSSPTAVIPNVQQPIPSTISNQLIQIFSTPLSLAVLDVSGGILLMLPAPAGYYTSTDMSYSPVPASMPVVSQTVFCIGGTYKQIPAFIHVLYVQVIHEIQAEWQLRHALTAHQLTSFVHWEP